MRLAIIADIHGNLASFERVLADMETKNIDQIICLGDVAVLGPQPDEVITRIRELNIPSVLGNTDAWLLDGIPEHLSGDDGLAMREIAEWSAGRLSDASWSYLRSIPMTLDIELDDGRLLLCFHGSPRSFDDVISATTPDHKIDEMLADHDADIYAGGHTHIQLLRRHGIAQIINPGSVGLPGTGPGTPDLPINRNVHWAEYATLDTSPSALTFHRIHIPLPALQTDMPGLEWWLSLWGEG